jgi:S-DNA-T family DNA segregation ATPase FtsK/SpoIIIE
MEEKNIMKYKPEFITSNIDFIGCVNEIANIPIKLNSEASQLLPENYGFLEMYNVGNVKQLNSINRWKNSQVTNSLAAPIGIDSNNNVLNLDLHEKKHGPHGLIAGMTGSGKSETIITYILSLAVNYSPNEVQFVLIDYKGGGLAGAFENRKTGMKLPHLVGTITNLDKASMNRTLVSIKSELQRRQKVFNEAKERLNSGVIDI